MQAKFLEISGNKFFVGSKGASVRQAYLLSLGEERWKLLR